MKTLIPIKVKIGLKPDGGADYPNFNALQVVKDSGMDWAKYIDVEGTGWHYDKQSGHNEETPDSPRGQQYGLLLVPESFVNEALDQYPDEVEVLTEAQAKTFYEQKAHAHEPDEEIDEVILTGIKLKQDLGQVLTPEQLKALDPIDDTPGIRTNKDKKWTEYKKKRGVKIKKPGS